MEDASNTKLKSAFQEDLQILKDLMNNALKTKEMQHKKREEMNDLTSISQQNNALKLGDLNLVAERMVFMENYMTNVLSEAQEDIEENSSLDDELFISELEFAEQLESVNDPVYEESVNSEITEAVRDVFKIENEIQKICHKRAIVKDVKK